MKPTGWTNRVWKWFRAGIVYALIPIAILFDQIDDEPEWPVRSEEADRRIQHARTLAADLRERKPFACEAMADALEQLLGTGEEQRSGLLEYQWTDNALWIPVCDGLVQVPRWGEVGDGIKDYLGRRSLMEFLAALRKRDQEVLGLVSAMLIQSAHGMELGLIKIGRNDPR